MNIFRAIVHKGEFSRRALNLTTELLEFNPANYTVW
jgi:protein farnesyltransferase/geranylgeranyltransferase type-1 subunit alpha